jgi:hypothetical protein
MWRRSKRRWHSVMPDRVDELLHGLPISWADVQVQIRFSYLLIPNGELPPQLQQDSALLLLAVVGQALHDDALRGPDADARRGHHNANQPKARPDSVELQPRAQIRLQGALNSAIASPSPSAKPCPGASSERTQRTAAYLPTGRSRTSSLSVDPASDRGQLR